MMWFKKLLIKLRKRSFGNNVLLKCNSLIYELLESDNNDLRKWAQKRVGNNCFDVIRKNGKQEIMSFRKELVEKVLDIVQSDDPVTSMRKELIKNIHLDTINRTFFLVEFQDRRQELYDALNDFLGDSKIINCDGTASVIFFWSEAQCFILRLLQDEYFEKMEKDDWFSVYSKGYQNFIELLFKIKLSNKDKIDSVQILLFTTHKTMLEALQKKLVGEVIA